MVTLAMFHDKPGVNFVLWTVSEARSSDKMYLLVRRGRRESGRGGGEDN